MGFHRSSTICGFTAVQINTIVDTEGIQDIDALNNVCLKDVKRMTENLSLLRINQGGAYIGTGDTTDITALIWWIQYSRAQGLVPDPNAWNKIVLNNARQSMNLKLQSCDSASENIATPKRLYRRASEMFQVRWLIYGRQVGSH